MDVDAARHDEHVGGVDDAVGGFQRDAGRDVVNAVAIDENVGAVGVEVGNQGAVTNEKGAHAPTPAAVRMAQLSKGCWVFDPLHGDALLDRADQCAEIAAYAFVLIDAGDAREWGVGRWATVIEFGDRRHGERARNRAGPRSMWMH